MSVAWVGAGIAAVGVAASASSASKASKAQGQASQEANATQLQSQQDSIAFQREMANQARSDQEPWRQAGISALNQLSNRTGQSAPPRWGDSFVSRMSPAGDLMTPSTAFSKPFSFEADPGYDFRMAEGMRGIDNSAAARGGVLSGAALKAASKYNQNFASNEYGNSFNRYQTENTNQFNRDTTNQTNSFNRLASIAGVGQTAANQMSAGAQALGNNVGNTMSATGNQIAQNQLGAGNARASGYIGQSNALNGGLAQGFNMYQQNQMMNSLSGYQGQNNAMSYANPYSTQGSDLNAINGTGSIRTGL